MSPGGVGGMPPGCMPTLGVTPLIIVMCAGLPIGMVTIGGLPMGWPMGALPGGKGLAPVTAGD